MAPKRSSCSDHPSAPAAAAMYGRGAAKANAAPRPVAKSKTKAKARALPAKAAAKSAAAKVAVRRASVQEAVLPADIRRSCGSLLMQRLGSDQPLTSSEQLRAGLGVLAVVQQQVVDQGARLRVQTKSASSGKKRALKDSTSSGSQKISKVLAKAESALLEHAHRTRAATGGKAPHYPLQSSMQSAKSGERPKKGKTRLLQEMLAGISKPDFRRVARRAGARRMASLMYIDARLALKEFLQHVVGDASVFVDCSKRKVVASKDVLLSLRRRGRILYGFDL